MAHVVTVAWNETYKGLVSDEFLNGLYLNEEERAINSYKSFNENENIYTLFLNEVLNGSR